MKSKPVLKKYQVKIQLSNSLFWRSYPYKIQTSTGRTQRQINETQSFSQQKKYLTFLVERNTRKILTLQLFNHVKWATACVHDSSVTFNAPIIPFSLCSVKISELINFKGANTELKVAINQNLKQLLRDMYCKIKYNFIHPALHIWKEHRNVWWD